MKCNGHCLTDIKLLVSLGCLMPRMQYGFECAILLHGCMQGSVKMQFI